MDVLELLDYLVITKVPLVPVGLLLVEDKGLGVPGNHQNSYSLLRRVDHPP